MDPLRQALTWLSDPAHWQGPPGILQRLAEHLQMTAVVMVIAILLAVPLGLAIGHGRRGELLAVNAGSVGRALPSFAVLAFAFPLTLRYHLPGGFGYWPTLIALVLLAVPPLITNSYVGVRNVDPDTLEAGRGMGMGELQVLLGLELPLAIPLILETTRTVAVQVVATATLGSVVGWGGLGRFIVDGFATGNTGVLLGGAILVAALAIVVDAAFGLFGRLPVLERVRVRMIPEE
jgi:osmoprotectant transport system permease protein